ncbi:MAG: hypothetical protein COA94_02975 [Rickettsiales bacterium]|nr:MAG: hypothetical protein COA94_02975 [Rickettsiales bacterium]
MYGGNTNMFVLWFVLLTAVVWFLLYTIKPSFIQKKDSSGETTGESNNGKAFLWSLGISAVLLFILWAIKQSSMSY